MGGLRAPIVARYLYTTVEVVDLGPTVRGQTISFGGAAPGLRPNVLKVVSIRVDTYGDVATIACKSAQTDEFGFGPQLEQDFAVGQCARCRHAGAPA